MSKKKNSKRAKFFLSLAESSKHLEGLKLEARKETKKQEKAYYRGKRKANP